MHKLRQNFNFLAAILVAGVAATLSAIHERQDGELTRRLVSLHGLSEARAMARAIADAAAPHIAAASNIDAAALRESSETAELADLARRLTADTDVLEILVTAVDGVVVFSPASSEIGSRAPAGSPAYEAVRSNRPVSVFGRDLDRRVSSEAAKPFDILRIAMPFTDERGRTFGALVATIDVSGPLTEANAAKWRAILLGLAICMALYFALSLVVARGGRDLAEQYDDIHALSANIEKRVEERTAKLAAQQRVLGDVIRHDLFRDGTAGEAMAILTEAAVEVGVADRCAVCLEDAGTDEYLVLDQYDRAERTHRSGFRQSKEFYLRAAAADGTDVIAECEDIASNARATSAVLRYAAEHRIRSVMDVPIVLDGTLKGLLCLRVCGEPRDWSAEDRLFALSLAQLAALVLERVERRRAEAARADDAVRLSGQQAVFNQLLLEGATGAEPLADVLRPMSRLLAEHARICRAEIFVLNDARTGCLYAEVYDNGSHTHMPSSDVGSLADRVAYMRSRNLEPRILGAVDPVQAADEARLFPGVTALVSAPVIVDGALAGTITCCRYDGPASWTNEQILFVTGMANHVALALERHQRHQAEQRLAQSAGTLARHQSILNELLGSESIRSGSVPAAMRTLSRVLGIEAGLDRVSIHINVEGRPTPVYGETYITAEDRHETPHRNGSFGSWSMLKMAKPGQLLLIDDVASYPGLDERFHDLLRPLDIRSFMLVPIEVEGRIVGIINASVQKRSIQWSSAQSLFATAIANLAALTIERNNRQRAEAEIAGVAHRLSTHQAALTEFMRDSVRHGSLDASLQSLSEICARTMNVERLSFWLLSDQKDALTCLELFDHGIGEHTNGGALHATQHPAYFAALLDSREIVIDDVTTDPRTASFIGNYFAAADVRSMMDMPIIAEGRTIGVVCAEKCGARIAWTEEQKLFLSAVTNLVALVIERHERRKAEQSMSFAADRLSRQQVAINDLMRDDAIRTGTLEEGLDALSRLFCQEAGIDRVAIGILARDEGGKAPYSRVYVAADDEYVEIAGRQIIESFQNVEVEDRNGIQTIDDVSQHPVTRIRYEDIFRPRGIVSSLRVPVMVQGRVAGHILASTVGRRMSWRPDQKLLATAIAQLAALIFERSERRAIEAKIAADADRLKRQLSLINGLMESETVRTSTLEDAIRTCMESFCRTADIDRVTVMLYADEINDFEFSQSYARARGSFEPVPAELQQRMRNTDRSRFDRRMTVDDLRSEPDVMAHFGGVIEHLGVRSAMQTPIQVQGRLVGAVQAFTVGRTTKWQADHEMTITAVAQIVALAVERHQRLRVERRLRHANRAAEEANKAKSLFLANMSHEIRTPMNGVFGMTDLLMQTELSERQSRLVGTINQSAKTLLTIINDILDVSRIESGKFELDRHEFDLRHCVEGAVEMFAEDAQKRGLELAFFMAGDVPELVVGDAVRLRQICINLIGNALKFTKAGHVSVRVEMVGQAPDTATVRFEINDTGIGIDPQVRERLFQPFAQADSSITRRFGGTGLGLSISRHLVQLMNGRIDLESTPGVGTRITFTLPMTIAAARTKEIRADISVLAGKRVLVVDDRDMNREIITAYLDGCGAKVDAARSAESALDQMRAAANEGSPFAVAIIDMIMPTLNGLELADLVRADPAIAKTELIMVTSMSWKGDAKAVRARGIRNLLTKPVRRSDLLEAVCNALTAASVPAGIAPVPADRAVRVRVDAHILVAEDNPVNEEVAREHLTSLGCTVSVARNGIEAVEAFGLGAFDLILMDCQMPELDGLSATQRIRAIEQTADAKRTPIVAVTANAFAEDRVACLAAGMDGYMSKPFTEDQLIDALNKWCPDRVAIELAAAPPAEAGNPRAAPPKPPRKKKASSKPGKPSRKAPPRDRSVEAMPPRPADLDPAFMVGLRDRTPKLFERLIETYLGHTPKTVESLANAVADGNVAALKLAAHSLKSSSANVGARRVAELARRLEALAAGNEPAAVAALACDLETEFEAVRREFQATLMARRKA